MWRYFRRDNELEKAMRSKAREDLQDQCYTESMRGNVTEDVKNKEEFPDD